MRKRFDAHVHIAPPRDYNLVDPRFDVRRDTYGRITFGNGRSFETMPCYLADSRFTADTLVHTLERNGVQEGMLLLNLYFDLREEIAKAVEAYPGRLHGAMFVEPTPDYLEQMHYWHKRGLTALKFVMVPFGFLGKNTYAGMRFDDEKTTLILDEAERLGLTVTIDTGAPGTEGYQVEAYAAAVASHPSLRFVICHLGNPNPNVLADQALYARWEEMVDLARYDNVWIDFSSLTDRFAQEGYPFPTATSLFKKCLDRYGDSKFIWGTDIPATLTNATYAQMINTYERCPFLSEDVKDKLFYDNAVAAYL